MDTERGATVTDTAAILDREQALKIAQALIHALQGYRKNPDYRTIQNDLNAVALALQTVSENSAKAAAKN